MSAAAPALRVEDLRKSFGQHEVLKGIDLELAPHEVVCLIGASGSGKSTLLRCINLLEPIDAGRIEFLGEEISAQSVDGDRVRRNIGIVFQAFNLFPHMSVLRNVTLGPRDALHLPRREAEERAIALLDRFGLADKRDEYPDRLSGGQQQRVAIVRALAMQPRLMLLDEVTSALDPELVAEVLEVIRELAEGGMTMLIATHEMSFARDIASRVCFLDAGVILEEGPPERIFSAPREPRTQQFLRRIDPDETLRDGSSTTNGVVSGNLWRCHERAVPGRPVPRVALTHLDRVFWPEQGLTKRDLVDYYRAVAPVLVPHLRDRPFTIKRHYNGPRSPFAWSKDAPPELPDWIPTAPLPARSRRGGLVTTERSRSRRRGVFVDTKMNGHGQQVVAPYSIRPVPAAAVASPLGWEEVDERLDPAAFTLDSVRARVEREGDLAAPLLRPRQRLDRALARLGA